MPRGSTFAWIVSVGAFIALNVASASADTTLADLRPKSKEAQKHLSEGKKHYDLGEWDKAIAEYKAGALIEPAPMFNFNLAQVYRQAGDYRAAIFQYERFLAANPPPDLELSVHKLLDQMRGELDRKAMKQPPTDAITGTEEKPGRANPPAHEPVAAPSPAEPWYADTVGWALVGTGVVGSAIAGYLWLDGGSLNDQANHESDQQRRRQLQDQAHSRNVAGTIVGVAGLGLLVAGGIKLVIHPHDNGKNTAVTLHLSMSAISVEGRF